ncbi:Hsp70 family protein [Brumicola nitratireducens]|uniref:Putative heat shock protein 70 family protein n=1 Tax=Glaciecola nitratireducens (strain JCM 12485 / KCTC 12276 / FR1064) TaxID=1085623 RepID=G4QFA8_GLANF|nr:Hsp70 family protein [Glaciecola nitratireducens]AEP28452.1 putative heat shock protein 70 family protein [Glaciecola nitratireducens FR1064]
MAAIGIDYGTSNSEVVYFDGKQHHFIKLDPNVEQSNKIRSSVFVYYKDELPRPPVSAIEAKVSQIQRAINDQLEKAKNSYYEAKDPREQRVFSEKIDDLRAQYHNKPALQRQAIQLLLKYMTVQDLSLHQLVETGEFAFGEEGFKRYLKTPDKGRLIYSPKNFLGAHLVPGQKAAFVGMIAKQLAYFRQSAEQQLNQTVDTAVIGRPVKFHGTRGEEGNNQAIDIMTEAAKAAGFAHVEFLEEPIAAAYKIEPNLAKPTNVLVVDIGGGTTDICCIKLSPEKRTNLNRQQDVMSVTGARIGGMECDKNLIVKSIAPTMGQDLKMTNGLPVPPTYFSDMCAVDDIPKLNRFFSDEYGLDIAQTMSIIKEPKLLGRLLTVQEDKLSARLVNSSRLAKEMLSSKDEITLPLHYIEADYDVDLSVEDLNRSMKSWLSRVKRLVVECLENSSEEPEMLFITGGMSLSPIVRKQLTEEMLPNLPLIEGDAFNSVCEGLAIQAARL